MAKPKSDQRRLVFAQLRFEGKTVTQASETVGIPFETGKDWNTSPDVNAHLEELKKKFLAEAGPEIQLTKEMMLAKLAALAELPPSVANANAIVKAIDCTLKVLDFFRGVSDPGNPKPTGPDIYRSAWNRNTDSDSVQ